MRKKMVDKLIEETEEMIRKYKNGLKWYKQRLKELKETSEKEGARGKQIGYVIRGDLKVKIYENVLKAFRGAETQGDRKRVIQKYYPNFRKPSSVKSSCWDYKQAVLRNKRYRRVNK